MKIALASPKIRLCAPEYNAQKCVECAREANETGADVIVFPELVLSGATAGDLFFQELLIDCCEEALSSYARATAGLSIMSFIGLPISLDSAIYNAVACVLGGSILGITISGETSRQFTVAPKKRFFGTVCQKQVEIGRNLVFEQADTGANIIVKIGDDSVSSVDGVNIILNPVAMTEYVGLSKIRRAYACEISSEINALFALVGAGEGESGTDGIYASPRLVAHNGRVIAESPLFDLSLLYADVDLDDKETQFKPDVCENTVHPFPFVPEDLKERNEACSLALEIQSRALALRIERAYAKCVVLGVSGGLDSTLAVLVAAGAMDILGRSRRDVLAITMPCFGTTERTKNNALALAEELGCSVRTIDIKNAVNQHFADISHDKDCYDVVYENAQARERTQILMDVANAEGGLVVGTGDLSELALGFATYNGDHMSMYCVNGSVPKTFMRTVIGYVAECALNDGNKRLSDVLFDVINTPVSPELLPSENGENKQHTESIVGPYELHDFFLYYTVKYGYKPRKILELATSVFSEYKKEDIEKYLEVFIRRFFSQQFKRSCMPDGPRVTEISLSPRSSWEMPSDVSFDIWRENIKTEG